MKGYATVAEAAKELKLDKTHVTRLCREGQIEGAELFANVWFIPTPVVYWRAKPPGYVYARDAVIELGVTRGRVHQLCQGGRIEGAKMVGGRWVMPSPVKRLPPDRTSGRPKSPIEG